MFHDYDVTERNCGNVHKSAKLQDDDITLFKFA